MKQMVSIYNAHVKPHHTERVGAINEAQLLGLDFAQIALPIRSVFINLIFSPQSAWQYA